MDFALLGRGGPLVYPRLKVCDELSLFELILPMLALLLPLLLIELWSEKAQVYVGAGNTLHCQ